MATQQKSWQFTSQIKSEKKKEEMIGNQTNMVYWIKNNCLTYIKSKKYTNAQLDKIKLRNKTSDTNRKSSLLYIYCRKT